MAKISREALKRDELRDFGADLFEWYEARKTKIWIVVGVVLALLILMRVWGAYSEKRKIEAGNVYNTALEAYQQAMMTSDAAERDKQIVQVQTISLDLRNRYPGTIAARQSLLLQGNALFLGNSPDRAVQLFKEYHETAGKPDERATALISMGYGYENLFFRSEMKDESMSTAALEHFVRAAEEAKSPDLKRQAMIGQARIFEIRGLLPQAVEVYKRIIEMAEKSIEEDSKKFIDQAELENKKFPVLNPADMHNSLSIAKQQLERLELLIQAGDKILAEQSLPPASAPATAPTTAPAEESLSADTQPATAPVNE